MLKFARALKAAADKSSDPEAVKLVQRARWHPMVMLALRNRMAEEARLLGVVGAGVALPEIDWEALLDFFLEMLPYILQLIQLLLTLFL